MFDINFHLFHDEELEDFPAVDQQQPAPASLNKTNHQRLRAEEEQSGLNQWRAGVPVRSQGGDKLEHLRFLLPKLTSCRFC